MSADRLLHLLTEQTERPLTRPERAELDQLLLRHPDWRADDFELAAAAAQLAFLDREVELPDALAKAILAEAMPSFADRPSDTAKIIPLRRTRPALVWSGWIAAAAAVVIAILSWWVRPEPSAPDAASLRAELMAKPGVLRIEWSATDDPAASGLAGDVVWDNETQRGFMRFEGLARNDPAQTQYQLWIFDGHREEAHPVDGGVFDAGEGAVIVPIDAKIRVFEPAAFAVTVEPPGGVVVSKRERVVALAKVAG